MSIERPAPHSATPSTPDAVSRVMPSRWIYFPCDPLPYPEAEARRSLGGKGFSLHQLARADVEVPPAFTITTEACEHYLSYGRQLPEGLWEEVLSAVARLERLTGRSFGHGPHPLTLAVRSGGVESMPGLMATILHCGLTESLVGQLNDAATRQAFTELLKSAPGPLPNDPESHLRQAVSAVFDSWDKAAVQRFRELHGTEDQRGTAVTIQAMFPAEISGVAFSRDPQQPNHDDMVIEAVQGLGTTLVGGQATPARWHVERNSFSIRNFSIPESISANHTWTDFAEHGLQPLWQAVKRIESIFQVPVDVEFGYARGELVFFQARPIAQAVQSPSLVERARQDEIDRVQRLAGAGRNIWVRHNLAETLPAPTLFTWDLWRDFMSGRGGYGKLYRQLGYRPSALVNEDGFLELIAGRIYADPQRLPEMICTGYPLRYDTDAIRKDPNVINQPPTRLDLEQLDPWFVWRWPLLVVTLICSGWRRRHFAKCADRDFDSSVVPRLREYVARERQLDLSSLSVNELLKVFEQRRSQVFDHFAPQTLLPGTLGAAAWTTLEQRLRPVLGDVDCQTLLQEWSAQIANPLAVRERELLHQIGRGKASVDTFLAEYGHRGPNEMDLSAPRWREQPAAVQEIASRMATSPLDPRDNEIRQSPDERLRIALVRNGAGSLHRELSPILGEALRLLPYREAGKHELLRAYELLRDVLLELGRRLNVGDGIHFLTLPELRGTPSTAMSASQQDLLVSRREAHQALQQLHVPAVFEITDDLTDFGRRSSAVSMGRVFAGTTISLGQANGRIHVLNAGQPFVQLPANLVIVASTLDPGWVPFLANTAALVVEQGGMLSHVALLARQFSIPMVVVPNITRQVQEGEAIRVDADRGRVELTDRRA